MKTMTAQRQLLLTLLVTICLIHGKRIIFIVNKDTSTK